MGVGGATGAQPGTTRYVSEIRPVQGPSRVLAAQRSSAVIGLPRRAALAPDAHPWRLQASLPGVVIKDLSFASPSVGYLAAELGQVWKTSDGGQTWTRVMNLGFPYYWYGVDALTETDVVVSGFNNSNFQGILRWSHDGGLTWSSDVILTTDGWSFRVRFADPDHGLVVDGLNLDAPNAAHDTTDGGQTAGDWTETIPDSDGGWFGNQFSLLPTLRAWLSGITLCTSPDGGASWGCRPSVDPVFDGATQFVNGRDGWVGGGTISPAVEGWVHRTVDGGRTWSDRTLDGPWPIREIHFPPEEGLSMDPLPHPAHRVGRRRQQLLRRRRSVLLAGRRPDLEPGSGHRRGDGRVRPPAGRPAPPGVVRGLRCRPQRRGVHPGANGPTVSGECQGGDCPRYPPLGERSARAPSRALLLPEGRLSYECGQTLFRSASRGEWLSRDGRSGGPHQGEW